LSKSGDDFPACLQAAGLLSTMLSSKGTFCGQKDAILLKMQALLDQLQSLKDASQARLAYRQAAEDTTKRAWLDAEGQHAVLRKSVEREELNVKDALNKLIDLQKDVEDEKARLANMRRNNSEALQEIDEEEGIIKEILSYIQVCARPGNFPNMFRVLQ
jgi:chromosome segregation ATPase